MSQEEFQQAVYQLRPHITELAQHYLADHEKAEDAAQDALLRLWQMHERLHSPIDGLANTLTRNICIDQLRRQHPTISTSQIEAEDTEPTNHQQVERIMQVVDSLPELQQTILRLRHMQGMEMKELAAMLQMNEAAVRKALSRARMAVRDQYLKQQGYE